MIKFKVTKEEYETIKEHECVFGEEDNPVCIGCPFDWKLHCLLQLCVDKDIFEVIDD